MNIRQRKLIGTVVFVAGSVSYFFVAITIAIARLPGTPMECAASILSRRHIDLAFLFGPFDTLDAKARSRTRWAEKQKGRLRGPSWKKPEILKRETSSSVQMAEFR